MEAARERQRLKIKSNFRKGSGNGFSFSSYNEIIFPDIKETLGCVEG
jgi:hypothetical protein